MGAIETVHAYLRQAAADGVAVLLDQRGPRRDSRARRPAGGHVRGERSSARSTRARRRWRRSGFSWPAGGRALRRSSAARAAVVAVRRRARRLARRRLRDHGGDPRGDGPRPRDRRSSDIVDAGFTGNGAMTGTLISATPILFTGLAAAAAFRMQLFNIGAEGQLYLGAIGAAWIALKLGDHGDRLDAALRPPDVCRGRGARRASGR